MSASPDRLPEWSWLSREYRPFRPRLAVAFTARLMATALVLGQPLIIKWLIDQGLRQRFWLPIAASIGLYCALEIGQLALIYASTLMSTGIAQRVTTSVRRRVMRHVQTLDAAFFDRRQLGELVRVFEQDVDEVGRIGAQIMPSLVRMVLGVVASIGCMFALDWRLSCVLLPVIAGFVVLRHRFRPRLGAMATVARDALGTRANALTEMLAGGIHLQAWSAERFFMARYGRTTIAAARTGIDQQRVELRYYIGTHLTLVAGTALMLAAGAYDVLAGALTIGGYVAFYTYVSRIVDPLVAAVEMYAALKRAGGSIERIQELEHATATMAPGRNVRRLASVDCDVVTCTDVTMSHGSRQVLRGVNGMIGRGERVALVGPSGIGKTTLARLIARHYDADSGAIRFNEINVRDCTPSNLRSVVAYVPAQPWLFEGTIRENVLLGSRVWPDVDLNDSAHIACFDEVLRRWPEGWDHALGPNGAGLSEGERQRLGLLRALVRGHPVLILDETTGAVDWAVEAHILDRLTRYVRDRIVLVISHRPAVSRWADRTLVLERGRLRDEEHVEAASGGRLVDANPWRDES